MLKERRIRALVVINPTGFFYSHGKPKGMAYEMLEQLQADLLQEVCGSVQLRLLDDHGAGLPGIALGPTQKSPAGAVGIMQVMPKYASGPLINIRDVSKADKNILAGVRMLNNIVTNYFNDPAIDEIDRTLFTFASTTRAQAVLFACANRRQKRV